MYLIIIFAVIGAFYGAIVSLNDDGTSSVGLTFATMLFGAVVGAIISLFAYPIGLILPQRVEAKTYPLATNISYQASGTLAKMEDGVYVKEYIGRSRYYDYDYEVIYLEDDEIIHHLSFACDYINWDVPAPTITIKTFYLNESWRHWTLLYDVPVSDTYILNLPDESVIQAAQ